MKETTKIHIGLKFIALLIAGFFLFQTDAKADGKRETGVPDNFFNFYVGFNSNQNVKNVETVNLTAFNINREFTFNSLAVQQGVWGGFSGGHWFTQAPVSLGFSINLDIFPADIPSKTIQDFTLVTNNNPADATLFKDGVKKDPTKLVQVVPGVNLLVGIPVKFFRIYGGVGPGLFASYYTFTFSEGTANERKITANVTKIGVNAFAGVDFFVSTHISVFVEGKYSKVNNLEFNSGTFLRADRQTNVKITEKFESLETRRVGIGLSVHF